MLKGNTWGIAESVDVRLPTGDELNLLGIAGPQVKLTFIASSAVGALSPHVNLAYTISGASAAGDDPETFVIPPPEEINYAAGADLALSLRTTVAVDVVGRVMRKVGTLTWGPTDFGGSYRSTSSSSLPWTRTSTCFLGSVGLKVNPSGTCWSRQTCCSRSRRTVSQTASPGWPASTTRFTRSRGYRFSWTDSIVHTPWDCLNLNTVGMRRGAGREPTLGSIDLVGRRSTSSLSQFSQIPERIRGSGKVVLVRRSYSRPS